MLVSVFLVLFLPCVGMSAVFIVYMCLVWFTAASGRSGVAGVVVEPPAKPMLSKGLSIEDLEKLPKVRGEELVIGNECAVCLDEIESDEVARIIPGCNHGFHLQCADTWLSKKSVCPVCRSRLERDFFHPSQDPC